MKVLRLSPVLFVILFVLSGCMSVDLSAVGYEKTASLTSSERKFTILKHFKREVKMWYAVVNLIPLTDPDIAGILRDETASAHGDAVLNITIKGQTSLFDAAVPVVTAFVGSFLSPQRGAFAGLLVGARTYTVEGDVVKYIEEQ